MITERLDYQKIVQDALRDAVRRVLAQVAEEGLPGEHYFYVGFRTDRPGVRIPRFLRDQYPEEMTVVLQNQFWNLDVGAESFAVTLSFNASRQRLVVPWEALTAFVDPTAEFGLRFDPAKEAEEAPAAPAAPSPAPVEEAPGRPAGPSRPGAVVPFDPKRRK